jgi:hypothetical protein
VEGVLEGCGTPDDKCYQDVLNTLKLADLDLDKQLDRRGLGQMISKTVKGAWDLFFDIAAMLLLNWQMKSDKMDNYAFHFPISRAQEAADLMSATSVVHSAGGSVVITVTPTSKPATLTGYVHQYHKSRLDARIINVSWNTSSTTPAITTVASDENGHKKGDLLAVLDADLARRIDEVVRRMKDCEDGREFDATHGSRKRAGTATYGQALCAAEGVIGMSKRGGAFADLTLLDHNKMGIEFAATAGKAKDALLVLKDFIIAYGPMLAIPEEFAERLGTYVLAIILDAIVIDNIPIGPQNYIGPELAVSYGRMSPKPTPTSTAPPSSSSSGCPDPTKTPVSHNLTNIGQYANAILLKLSCGWEEKNDCEIKLPDPMAIGPRDALCSNVSCEGLMIQKNSLMYYVFIPKDSVEGK